MMRILRTAAVLVLAVLLVAGVAIYLQQPSGGKAPAKILTAMAATIMRPKGWWS